MHTRTRLFLGGLVAALLLASAVSAASANRLSISNTTFRSVWSPLTFTDAGEGEGIMIACNATIEGSFHYHTIVKSRGALLGFVTRATIAHPCSGSGEAWLKNGVENNGLGTLSNTLPWHIVYQGFEGSLPSISGIRRLVFVSFTMRALSILCEYAGNAEGVVKLGRSGVATSIQPDPTVSIPKSGGSALCPSEGFFSANAERSTITQLGNTQTITITLI